MSGPDLRFYLDGKTIVGDVTICNLMAKTHHGETAEHAFEQGIPRVYSVLKLDERRDKPDQTLDDKVRSVEERLP